MGITGLLAIVTGVWRAWLSGVQSMEALSTGYGLVSLMAFIVAFFWLGGVDGFFRRRFRLMMRDPRAFAEHAAPLARRNAVAVPSGVLVVVLLMAVLGLGLA